MIIRKHGEILSKQHQLEVKTVENTKIQFKSTNELNSSIAKFVHKKVEMPECKLNHRQPKLRMRISYCVFNTDTVTQRTVYRDCMLN